MEGVKMKVSWQTVALIGMVIAGGLAALLTGNMSSEAFIALMSGTVGGSFMKQLVAGSAE